jgi:hypothetical protein
LQVESFLERQEVADDTAKDEGATAVKGISSGGFGTVGLSDEMQEFLGDGTTALSRSQATLLSVTVDDGFGRS